MKFEITALSPSDRQESLNTPFQKLYADFTEQFDRVCAVTNGSTALRCTEPSKLVTLERNPRALIGIVAADSPLAVTRDIEVSSGTQVGFSPVWGDEFYVSRLILRAAGVCQENELEQDVANTAEWVPGLSLQYDVTIPPPRQLLRDFGIDSVVRSMPFDDFGNNRRTVFEINNVTASSNGSYEASIVCPAVYAATVALRKMPTDAEF